MGTPSRADFYTASDIQPIYLSDFTTNFDLNPVTGLLAKVNNEEAAKSMLRNLILTTVGERPFQPLVGSKIFTLLFEPADAVTMSTMQTLITQTINNNLRFINLLGVSITDLSGQNAYGITIVFSLINSIQPVSVNIVLRRVR